MSINKFWNHVEDAIKSKENLYYIDNTLYICFSIDNILFLNADGTCHNNAGDFYQPEYIHKLVIEFFRKEKDNENKKQ